MLAIFLDILLNHMGFFLRKLFYIVILADSVELIIVSRQCNDDIGLKKVFSQLLQHLIPMANIQIKIIHGNHQKTVAVILIRLKQTSNQSLHLLVDVHACRHIFQSGNIRITKTLIPRVLDCMITGDNLIKKCQHLPVSICSIIRKLRIFHCLNILPVNGGHHHLKQIFFFFQIGRIDGIKNLKEKRVPHHPFLQGILCKYLANPPGLFILLI